MAGCPFNYVNKHKNHMYQEYVFTENNDVWMEKICSKEY